jgi:hypothetical protein
MESTRARVRGTTQIIDRMDAERTQRVDLFGDLHCPDFGGDRGANSSATISPVNTGPSSRNIDTETTAPTADSMPRR